MLKALIKKELLQINWYFFYNSKTKKQKSKLAIAGTIALVLVLFCSLASAFIAMAYLLFNAFHSIELDWLYFSFMGLIAIVLGVFGDVFNTYTQLYKAKDNELLLSMPIPPSKLVFARVLGVFVMGFTYSSLVYIPALIIYWTHVSVSVAAVVSQVFSWICIGLFVSVLTCALGWVVAIISSKLKGKAYTRVLFTLLFLAAYYIIYFKAINGMEEWLTHTSEIASAVSGWTFLLYHMGLGAAGKIGSLILYAAVVLLLFILTCIVLNRTYIKMVTTNKGSKKVAYRREKSKSSSVFGALLRKERQHYSSNSTYMLNTGLGLLIMIVGSVFLLIKQNAIRELLNYIPLISEDFPWVEGALPVALFVAQMLLICMNGVSAPSVSLEGNTIWVLQTSPVSGSMVLLSKIVNHLMLCEPPVLLFSVVVAFVCKLGFIAGLLLVLAALTYTVFVGVLGVCIDNAKANLNWTSEVYPVKQGFSVTVIILGGWGFSIITGGLYFLLRNVLSGVAFLGIFTTMLLIASILLYKRLITKGSERFKYLS